MSFPFMPLALTYNGQLRVEQPKGVCVGSGACSPAGIDWLAPLFVLVSTGALTLFLLIALAHLREARSICEEERSRTRAERDAFLRFADRVTDLEANPTDAGAPAVDGGPIVAAGTTPTSRQLARVRDAYRETVMAVPHYEEDYGEPLEQNMRAELGEEVTMAVVGGDQFTPGLRQALVEKSRQAADRREEFLRTLEREADELARADTAFVDIEEELAAENERGLPERSFDELRALWEHLDDLEERCEEVLEDRQQKAGRKPTARGAEETTFHEYLYGPLSTDHPVLADGTRLIDRIRTAKHRVIDSLSHRA